MQDWDKLRIFYTVAQAHNITRAAEELEMNQSSVSRQIQALEQQMNTNLFHRRPRGLLLTEQGELLLATVSDFFQKLIATENALLETEGRPKGELKVAIPVAIGTVWLVPMVKEFMQLYPEVQITILAQDDEVDLSMREADVAIRFYSSKQQDLIQRKMFMLPSSIYASSDYLRKRGTPNNFQDLKDHTLIAYNTGKRPPFGDVNWMYKEAKKQGVKLTPSLSINNLYGMQRAVKNHIGIAPLPDYMVGRSRRIVRILPQVEGPTIQTYFVYSSDLRNSKRIRTFSNFMMRKIIETGF